MTRECRCGFTAHVRRVYGECFTPGCKACLRRVITAIWHAWKCGVVASPKETP
jgi:hypothetical protein